MKTYQLNAIVEENGSIVLPQNITRTLKKHRVHLTLIDLETLRQDPVKLLQEITGRYRRIVDEPDLDMIEIYKQREQQNVHRETLFA